MVNSEIEKRKPEESVYFRSKRGWVLGTVIWGIMGSLFYLTIFPFFDLDYLKENWNAALFVVPFWIGLMFILGAVWWGTGYRIKGDKLYVQLVIIIDGTIEISDIGSIESSYSLATRFPWWAGTNSPALAIKGLMIHFWGGHVKITPKDDTGFIAKIKVVNPDVKVIL